MTVQMRHNALSKDLASNMATANPTFQRTGRKRRFAPLASIR